MSGNMAVLVGCRLIAIWFAATAVQQATAWVAIVFQIGQFSERSPYSMDLTLLVGVVVTLSLAVGLWLCAPALSRAGGSGSFAMSGDSTRSLLKVLGFYFVVRSLADIAQYIALSLDETTANVWRAMGRGQQLAQTITFLVAGVLLIVGVEWIKRGAMKVARYGLEEPKDNRSAE